MIVEVRGSILARRTRVKRLLVTAPKGARVMVRCRGRRCPTRKAKTGVSEGRKLRFRAVERLLRPGTRITVTVSMSGFIGKHTTFVIRRGRPPRRSDLCLPAGTTKPERCPTP